MKISVLGASLYKVLLNKKLVSEDKLIRALLYQLRPHRKTHVSFAQTLIAFNYLHHQELRKIRNNYLVLDEEPIGQLLYEAGKISAEDLIGSVFEQRSETEESYLGDVLERKGILYQEDIRDFLKDYLTEPESLLDKKEQAMAHYKLLRGKLQSKYFFTPETLDQILPPGGYELPLIFKPLADVLLLSGDFSERELHSIHKGGCYLENEPIFQILVQSGLVKHEALEKWKPYLQHAHTEGKNPAVALTEHCFLLKGELIQAVVQYYQKSLKTGFMVVRK